MKIPFDIKYRPQIESGEYKVVTGDDRPVRIISWDKKVYGGRTEIVALVHTSQGDTESVQLYCPDGTLIASNWNEKFKLFIVTPEPELTEFEKCLLDYAKARDEYEFDSTKDVELNQKVIELTKSYSKTLIAIAKKELCKDCVLKAMEEIRVYKYEGPTPPVYWPPCYYGGPCTNPHFDCINCPRRSIQVGYNTSTGTSTSKLEEK